MGWVACWRDPVGPTGHVDGWGVVARDPGLLPLVHPWGDLDRSGYLVFVQGMEQGRRRTERHPEVTCLPNDEKAPANRQGPSLFDHSPVTSLYGSLMV